MTLVASSLDATPTDALAGLLQQLGALPNHRATHEERLNLFRAVLAVASEAGLAPERLAVIASAIEGMEQVIAMAIIGDRDEVILADLESRLVDPHEAEQVTLAAEVDAFGVRLELQEGRLRQQSSKATQVWRAAQAFQRRPLRRQCHCSRRRRARRTRRTFARRAQADSGGSDDDGPSPDSDYPAEVLELTSEEAHLRTAPPPEDLCWAARVDHSEGGACGVRGGPS